MHVRTYLMLHYQPCSGIWPEGRRIPGPIAEGIDQKICIAARDASSERAIPQSMMNQTRHKDETWNPWGPDDEKWQQIYQSLKNSYTKT